MTPPGPRILIVEDEPKLARIEAEYLTAAGYATHQLDTGVGVVEWVAQQAPDLVVLDLMLPGRDGLEIIREIRRFSGVPVIMVTARVDEIDRLLGLELGADDYLCKPFSPRELVARVNAVLRRTHPERPVASDSLLTLDSERQRVRSALGEVELTTVEFRLLEALHRQPGRIFSRAQLMARIYRDGRIVSDRTIDSHVKKLRKKLESLTPHWVLIHSVYGAGYRYEPQSKG